VIHMPNDPEDEVEEDDVVELDVDVADTVPDP
jgi:hypothetical protein